MSRNKTRMNTVFPFHWKSQLSGRERPLVGDEKLDFSLCVDRYRFEGTAQTVQTSIQRKRPIRSGEITRKIDKDYSVSAIYNQNSVYKTILMKAFFQPLEQIAFQPERSSKNEPVKLIKSSFTVLITPPLKVARVSTLTRVLLPFLVY